MIFVTGLGMLAAGIFLLLLLAYRDSTTWRLDSGLAFGALTLSVVGVLAMCYSLLTFAIKHLP